MRAAAMRAAAMRGRRATALDAQATALDARATTPPATAAMFSTGDATRDTRRPSWAEAGPLVNVSRAGHSSLDRCVPRPRDRQSKGGFPLDVREQRVAVGREGRTRELVVGGGVVRDREHLALVVDAHQVLIVLAVRAGNGITVR